MNTIATTTTVGLKLQPLDVLFFRDGRPFMTGNEYMVSGLPMPQTFAGAIRTALLRMAGCDFRRLGEAMKKGETFADAVGRSTAQEFHWIGQAFVRGPWLARQNSASKELEVFVHVPAVLHQGKRDSSIRCRLNPLPAGQLPGWKPAGDQDGLRPLWLKQLEPTEPAEGYLTPAGLAWFLRGEIPAAHDFVSASELFALDYRTGIGISPDRLTAEDSQIFGRGFLALRPGVFLYGEVVLPESADDSLADELSLLPLGGEGRNVLVERLQSPYNWPSSQPAGDRQKPLVLLTTPCPFQAGWKPTSLADHLIAAAVPGSLAFSGWDLARGGPKPTRFAVPAGSAYFLESMPHDLPQSLAENEEERQQGWGHYLTGVWTDD